MKEFYSVREAVGFTDQKPKFRTVKKPAYKMIDFEFPTSEISDVEGKARAYLGVKHGSVSEQLGIPKEIIAKIKAAGVKVGVAIKPGTPLSSIDEIVDDLDMVLVMTVEPGFGGQSFMEDMMAKVRELRKRKPELDIQVDGGINKETVQIAREAGANVFVAGSYIFKAEDRKVAIEGLR
jgi:ribulose-phosphate 3-epimerase